MRNKKGYYTVTIQGETAVNQQNAESPLTDTHKLLTNEQPILAVNPNDSVLYVKLEDYLFCLPPVGQQKTGL